MKKLFLNMFIYDIKLYYYIFIYNIKEKYKKTKKKFRTK